MRFNRNYFRNIDDVYMRNIKTLMTSEDVLEFAPEVTQLYTYYQQIICLHNPYIFLDNTLRVIFRQQFKIDQKQKNQLVSFMVTTKNKHTNKPSKSTIQYDLHKDPKIMTFHTINCDTQDDIKYNQLSQSLIQDKQNIQLAIIGRQDNQDFILKCLRYQQIWRNDQQTQIQKQIQCWEQQLDQFHHYHLSLWRKLEEQMSEYSKKNNLSAFHSSKQDYLQKQIDRIKKLLLSNQTFLYFKDGYADKISEELQKALQYIKQIQFQEQQERRHREKSDKQQQENNKKKVFDTDCKICFCTKNQIANQVIYCDNCATSFHQSCYGIEQLDKDAPFLCDVCQHMKNLLSDSKTHCKYDVPLCQICGKTKFPMKKLKGHFYHVSCLILFNFVQTKDYEIQLKPGINHEVILNAVIENQIENESCEYCFKNSFTGMRFHCDNSLCAKSFHPICAYLNGCKFQISRRIDSSVNVSVQCRDHYVKSLHQKYYQVYIRRFLCNYKNTCDIGEQKFNQTYIKQLQKLQKFNQTYKRIQTSTKRILKVTKTIHNWIQQKNQKKQQPRKQTHTPKKTSSLDHKSKNNQSEFYQKKKSNMEKLNKNSSFN